MSGGRSKLMLLLICIGSMLLSVQFDIKIGFGIGNGNGIVIGMTLVLI